MEDTIAAIATAVGAAGIGIVRLSGDNAIQIGERVTKLNAGKLLSTMGGYTCAFGHVCDEEGQIDEVVATLFRRPNSYTGENIVELSVHGGAYLLGRVLRACCTNGARLAEAGEFTKRAFLNGKLDLTRAEAIMDLISAQNKEAARAALAAKDGALYYKANEIAESLKEVAAHIAVWIDYPEDDIEEIQENNLTVTLELAAHKLNDLLKSYDVGSIIREGIDTVIIGRPNAGKSTLMNLLAGYKRSIVADVAGTTRDIVCDTVRLGDIILNLFDTAGIRESDDSIERVGVALAEDKVRKAQLILAVFDGTEELNENDFRVMQQCKNIPTIAIVNKNDLPQILDKKQIFEKFKSVVFLSARDAKETEELHAEIFRLFYLEHFDTASAMLANERQRNKVTAAKLALQDALEALKIGMSYDAVCVCIEEAMAELFELTGQRATQALVDQVFARFCVGK